MGSRTFMVLCAGRLPLETSTVKSQRSEVDLLIEHIILNIVTDPVSQILPLRRKI